MDCINYMYGLYLYTIYRLYKWYIWTIYILYIWTHGWITCICSILYISTTLCNLSIHVLCVPHHHKNSQNSDKKTTKSIISCIIYLYCGDIVSLYCGDIVRWWGQCVYIVGTFCVCGDSVYLYYGDIVRMLGHCAVCLDVLCCFRK